MMRLVLVLLVGLVTSAVASEGRGFAISAGVAYRHDGAAQDVTDDNGNFSWTEDYGYHARIGSGSPPSPGLIGWGGLELDWARNRGNDNRLDTLGVIYIERMPIGPVSLGLGLGSFYNDFNIAGKRSKDWNIGGTATLSIDVYGPFFLEGGYDLTSLFGHKTDGIKGDYMFLDLGFKF